MPFIRIIVSLVFVLLYFTEIFAWPSQGPILNTIDKDKGLTDNTVRDIIRGANGYIWIATEHGLNRFDGYSIEHFLHDNTDPYSLCGNNIQKVLQDPANEKYLWLVTNKGLCKFDKSNNRFYSFDMGMQNDGVSRPEPDDIVFDDDHNLWISYYTEPVVDVYFRDDSLVKTIPIATPQPNDGNLRVNKSFFMDSKSVIWLVHGNQGIQRMDIENNELVFYEFGQDNIVASQANVIEQDNGKFLIFLTYLSTPGVIIFDPGNGRSTFKKMASYSQSHYFSFNDVIRDYQGNLLLATTLSGVLVYNHNFELTDKLVACDNHTSCLSGNHIHAIYEDPAKNIWFGTFNSGVNVWFKEKIKFQNIFYDSGDNKFPLDDVVDVFEDSNGNIWFGTNGEGLFVKPAGHTNLIPAASWNIPEDRILVTKKVISIAEDKDGWLYFGQWGGLSRYHPKSKAVEIFNLEAYDSAIADNRFVWKVMCDSRERVWVGTLGGGLNRFDMVHRTYKLFRHSGNNKHGISNNYIFDIAEDKKGNVWVATANGGINLYNDQKQHFTSIKNNPENDSSLSNNSVYALFFDSKNQLWAATANGLNRQLDSNTFEIYTREDGLPSDKIKGVMEDSNGNLWITTINGLSYFNRENNTFKNYNKDYGLTNTGFNYGNPERTKDGTIYVYGPNGASYFHPDSLKKSEIIPPLVFNRLRIYNQPVQVGDTIKGKVILPQTLNYTTHLILDHTMDYFSVEFTALNFYAPMQIRYKYMLEGFDDQWIHSKANERIAAYTNIEPGEYVLKVLATNIDGVWGDVPRTLKITILPPWWQTVWFKMVSIGILFLLGILAYWLRIKSLVQGKKKLEILLREKQHDIMLQNEELKRQNQETAEMASRLHEADQAKIRFFMNISHEFRTPLTLILGPVNSLIEMFRDNHKALQQLRLIMRNSNRLLRLINQLLDLRKLETSTYKLQVKRANLVSFVTGVFNSFKYLARRQNISYHLNTDIKQLSVYFDEDILEKILYNLISNAFKYTPNGGAISVHLDVDTNNAWTLSVRDTGIGIEPHQLKHIFDRFYTVNKSVHGKQSGTGIGLALVKEMVSLHKGQVFAKSHPGEGTSIWFTIPGERKYFDDADVTSSIAQTDQEDKYPHITHNKTENEKIPQDNFIHKDKQTLLLIDDQIDILLYLNHCLEGGYNLCFATNGIEGSQKARDILPDLIISDIMMPGMDGVALCKALKSDEATCHIPVILLTSKSSEQNEQEGYETGAEGYIRKPFNKAVLEANVASLLANRKTIAQKFSGYYNEQEFIQSHSNLDQKFLSKAFAVINENIGNPEFSIKAFAEKMNMGKTTFYKKINALTGKSVNDFITHVKLKKAAELLTHTELSVSEVAFKTGYKNLSHFTRSFKNQYGVPPSEYAKSVR